MVTVKDLITFRLDDRKVGDHPPKHWAISQTPRVFACMFEVDVFANEYTVLITGGENSTDWRAFWRLDVVLCFVTDQATAAKKIAKEIAKNDPEHLTLWNVEIGQSADWVYAGAHLWKQGRVVNTLTKTPDWKIKK